MEADPQSNAAATACNSAIGGSSDSNSGGGSGGDNSSGGKGSVSPDGSGTPGLYVYHVKWISSGAEKSSSLVPIITQNANGPCPLIAIVNVLLLRGKMKLSRGTDVVTSEQLMEQLGDLVLSSSAKNSSSEEEQRNYEQNVQDGIAIFHKLQTGLDVNVKFSGVKDFEYTPECIVFDLLGIQLYHGWLVDPQEPELARATAGLGYNQLVEKIIKQKSSSNEALIAEALLCEQFLEGSASQLTYYGLCELGEQLSDGELCVLFRNNHFSTLHKQKSHLYQLVTDQGFLSESDVVWQSLDSIDGDCSFVDAVFQPSRRRAAADDGAGRSVADAGRSIPSSQVDHDYLLALSLQEESRNADGAERSRGPADGGSRLRTPAEAVGSCEQSDLELAKRLQEEEDSRAAAAIAAEAPRSAPTQDSGNTPTQRRQQQQPKPRTSTTSTGRDSPEHAENRTAASKEQKSCTLL